MPPVDPDMSRDYMAILIINILGACILKNSMLPVFLLGRNKGKGLRKGMPADPRFNSAYVGEISPNDIVVVFDCPELPRRKLFEKSDEIEALSAGLRINIYDLTDEVDPMLAIEKAKEMLLSLSAEPAEAQSSTAPFCVLEMA